MKLITRVLSAFLIAALLMGMIPESAFAEDTDAAEMIEDMGTSDEESAAEAEPSEDSDEMGPETGFEESDPDDYSDEELEEDDLILEEEELLEAAAPVDISKSTGIPMLNISIANASGARVTWASFKAGSKETKYPKSTVAITDTDGATSAYSNVTVKGRGNSTWALAKKPMQIKFESKENLFGLGKTKTYVLLANYYDTTSVRNKISFDFAKAIGMAYPNSGTWVDVYVDGSYIGLYFICHKVQIGSKEVDLSDPNGILVELDNLHSQGEAYKLSSTFNTKMLVKDTVSGNESLSSTAMTHFMSSYNALEKAVVAEDWKKIQSLIDVDSFAQYALMQELSYNHDGMGSSVYFHKDGDSDVIHAGPAWDYDLSFGNPRTPFGGQFEPKEATKTCIHWSQTLYPRLLAMEPFRQRMADIYQAYGHAALDQILSDLDVYESQLSQALDKNAKSWSACGNVSGQYAALREYLATRQQCLDRLYSYKPTVVYSSYVQGVGWKKAWSAEATGNGSMGKSLRIESIKIELYNMFDVDGSIEYRTHQQSYGWSSWTGSGSASGKAGSGKRVEAMQVRLRGSLADQYDVYYRGYCQTYGWLDWAKNGQTAGTEGLAKRMEAYEVAIVPKGSEAPGSTEKPFVSGKPHVHEFVSEGSHTDEDGTTWSVRSCWCGEKQSVEVTTGVEYRTHVQTYGWQEWKKDGDMSGTTGQAKRLEAINIRITDQKYEGGIEYRTHVQTYAWQDYVADGAMSGTSGQAKRLEAINIRLTGELAEHYDVYYCVHAQTYGWLGWAKNDEEAGTAGLAKRLEGIRIVLVEKDEEGNTVPPASIGTRSEAFISL